MRARLTGAKASETVLKHQTLTDYRTIAFATHGLMAGDFGRIARAGPGVDATGRTLSMMMTAC